jgi:hypothetical protein
MDGLAFHARIADTAFDSNAIRADRDARGAKAVIGPSSRNIRVARRRAASMARCPSGVTGSRPSVS